MQRGSLPPKIDLALAVAAPATAGARAVMVENPGKIPLHLIEVQSGSYLGKDDIIRYETIMDALHLNFCGARARGHPNLNPGGAEIAARSRPERYRDEAVSRRGGVETRRYRDEAVSSASCAAASGTGASGCRSRPGQPNPSHRFNAYLTCRKDRKDTCVRSFKACK
jgi:hypothetical protein